MKRRKIFWIWMTALWSILLLAAIGGATYAWFTFRPYTNVEPIGSTISSGEVALLINSQPDGEFGTKCVLTQTQGGDLEPLSTADLVHFYRVEKQDRGGIARIYRDCSNEAETDTIHGKLYLTSLKDNCRVYFFGPDLDFGSDTQMLSALRLGLRFRSGASESTYIFSLDQMGNTAGSEALQTTQRASSVVAGLGQSGEAVYANDPALAITDYFAVQQTATGLPAAGRQALCTIDANEVVAVEYWLYLEGCDVNCINAVQNKEAAIQLSFAGVTP